MRNRLEVNRILLFTTAIFFLSGCVTIYNPATERKEMLFLDTQQEVALGRDLDQAMQKKIKLLDNLLMQRRLNAVGNKVASVSDRRDLQYQFRIVDDKELNAFALPGGFIYVNSGLMQTANDHELACVLGHELGHIAARHSVKRLQTVLGYQLIIGIALGFSGQSSIGQAMDVVFSLVNLGYSRKDESLADRLCVRYAKRAGFNPYGAVTFFEKLKKEAESKGPNFNLVFLSSHPPIAERIKNIEQEIKNVSAIPSNLP